MTRKGETEEKGRMRGREKKRVTWRQKEEQERKTIGGRWKRYVEGIEV